MSDLDFETAPPAPSSAPFFQFNKFFNPETEKGQLLLVEVSHVQREKKYMSEEEADHLYGTVHVLTGPKAGEYSLRTAAGKFTAQLKGKSGKRVLGRLAQMDTGKGNPAWVLETDVTEEDKKVAREFLATGHKDDPPF